jgi:hypothetical protein
MSQVIPNKDVSNKYSFSDNRFPRLWPAEFSSANNHFRLSMVSKYSFFFRKSAAKKAAKAAASKAAAAKAAAAKAAAAKAAAAKAAAAKAAASY